MPFSTQLEIALDGFEQHDALHYWADSLGEARGEVFTKNEVVEFILDLSGWRIGEDLIGKRLLEPSCGSGDFVIPAIRRLLEDSPDTDVDTLIPCIRAIEVSSEAFGLLKQRVAAELSSSGFTKEQVARLIDAWLFHADFLTMPLPPTFSHVVGNPPYLRIEALPKPLAKRYRSLFRTMYDRADLYIAFFEKGLSLLSDGGRLGYICANRWTKNRYGGPLRAMIAESFHMETYVDFTGVDAFHGAVTAYPAVTIIRNGKGDETQIVDKEHVDCPSLHDLAKRLINKKADPKIQSIGKFKEKSSPWLLSNLDRLSVVQALEARLPTLEEAGCKVGIGVATGADRVFIGSDGDLDVEDERKLPLLTRRDLQNNQIKWHGKYVLNPFEGDSSSLVNPELFPRFKAYLERHREAITRRHVAKKNPRSWFKTIDRIYPSLTSTPKLLIPDIQGDPQVAYDPGDFYPHHNLYYVIADHWELPALQTLLRSSLATAFVATYSLRMRGDCLRFQAQYLRRIRLPAWDEVPQSLRKALAGLSTCVDQTKIDEATRELYGLDVKDWEILVRS